MKPAAFYYLPAILLIAFMSCNSPDNPGENPVIDEDLLDVAWKVDSLMTLDANLVFGRELDTPVTIHFSPSLSLVGQDPCQHDYEGTYHIPRIGSLEIDAHLTAGSCALIYPGELRLYLADIFISALTSVTSYTITDDRLDLYDDEYHNEFYCTGSLIDENLLNAVWQMDSLQTPDGKIMHAPDTSTAVTPGTTLTIEFNKNLEIAGGISCNDYYGTYKIGRDRFIEIDVLTKTEMLCPYSLDSVVITALEAANAYSLGERTMNLFNTEREYSIWLSVQ